MPVYNVEKCDPDLNRNGTTALLRTVDSGMKPSHESRPSMIQWSFTRKQAGQKFGYKTTPSRH